MFFFYGTQYIKGFRDDRPKMFYIFPAVFMFCKVNILLFSSLLNMITASVDRWIVNRWVSGRWSVGRWSVDLRKP